MKAGKKGAAGSRDPTVAAIERIQRDRERRRRSADQYRADRELENARNERAGKPGDVDFQRMIKQYRKENAGTVRKHTPPGDLSICIAVRKRPVNEKERRSRDYDSITCLNPRAIVHSCKLKVDGITKYLENQSFEFDHTFSEDDNTTDVYKYTVLPLVAHCFRGGHGTCFAYGQTGSGKTYTMVGVQTMATEDLFRLMRRPEHAGKRLNVCVSFFEIYGGRCSDLLHDRTRVIIREDGAGKVQAMGLQEEECDSVEGVMDAIQRGNDARTTHSTAVNSVSSRSHAICSLVLRDPSGKAHGRLSLIDLAGSERAADTRHHNRQRRMESAEINKSLLALKECMRALDTRSSHVPFRASKLTLILKDSFTAADSRVVMIATVSPTASAADHTQNTLRYGDRIKEKPAGNRGGGGAGAGGGRGPSGPLGRDIAFLDDRPGGEHSPALDTSGGPSSVRQSPVTVEENRDDNVSGEEDDEDDVGDRRGGGGGKGGGKGGGRRHRGFGPGKRRKDVEWGAPAEKITPVVTSPRGGDDDSDATDSAPRGGRGRGAGRASGGRAASKRRGPRAGAGGSGGGGVARGVNRRPPAPAPAPVPDRGSSSGANAEEGGGRSTPPWLRAEEQEAERRRSAARKRAARVLGGDGVGAGEGKDEEEGDAHEGYGRGRAKGRGQRTKGFTAEDDGEDSESDVVQDFRPALGGLGRVRPPPASSPPPRDEADALELDVSRDEKNAPATRAESSADAGEQGAAPSPQRDLHMLRATLQRESGEDAGSSGRWLEFHEVMDRIVEEEETLLNAHMSCIQENAEMLTEEGQLLSRVQGNDVVDYDIDGYAARLEQILEKKMDMTERLVKQLRTFRQHLALEDDMARRHETDELPVPWGDSKR